MIVEAVAATEEILLVQSEYAQQWQLFSILLQEDIEQWQLFSISYYMKMQNNDG